jgi:hypothetical protein
MGAGSVGGTDNHAVQAVMLITFALVFCSYFTPTIVARLRKHHQRGAILAVNLLLGWTVIGWVVALAMASSTVRRKSEFIPLGVRDDRSRSRSAAATRTPQRSTRIVVPSRVVVHSHHSSSRVTSP